MPRRRAGARPDAPAGDERRVLRDEGRWPLRERRARHGLGGDGTIRVPDGHRPRLRLRTVEDAAHSAHRDVARRNDDPEHRLGGARAGLRIERALRHLRAQPPLPLGHGRWHRPDPRGRRPRPQPARWPRHHLQRRHHRRRCQAGARICGEDAGDALALATTPAWLGRA